MAIQNTSANALTPIVAASYRENACGSRPGLFLASQLWVKLGTMRPPTSMINPIRAAIAIRMP